MIRPRIAVISFPGTNGDTENLRTLWRCGFDAFVLRSSLTKSFNRDSVDGYFIGAGFSYEDRGRSGMVAARDPIFHLLHEEAEYGKVIVGNCNGAQVLIESGLIPLGHGLKMSLARNAIFDSTTNTWQSPGFLNEWIWITPTCGRGRCATSDWEGVMKIPMAHGEGRFATNDPDIISSLEERDQIAFRYCDASGRISTDSSVTLNGSLDAIAGICNPRGNVVALMPHPERSVDGDRYFISIRRWIERNGSGSAIKLSINEIQDHSPRSECALPMLTSHSQEIFVDTIIVNNEERTVEQAARRLLPEISIKQYRYIAPTQVSAEKILSTISLFNPHKERAYVRKGTRWYRWNSESKQYIDSENPLSKIAMVRREMPDTMSQSLGEGSLTGVCYDVRGIDERDANRTELQEIFANPHSSTLSRLVSH